MVNILNGESNGPEKDAAWGWKSAEVLSKAGLRGFGALGLKMAPKRELQDFESTKASL